jgi:ABC-2 type transport system ATP-binding protein
MHDVAVACVGLAKRYGAVIAVDGLDLHVPRGECFGMLGPNGAGKTTTIEMIQGILAPDEGTIEILGMNWRDHDHDLRERMGTQLQETKLPEKLTVEEVVTLFRSFYRRGTEVADVLHTVSLVEKRSAFVKDLSGGQRQRLAVACALVCKPDILFLDEPTTGLDPQSRRQLWDVIESFRRGGGTVLITTHYMEEAERLCDRVAIIDHGKIIALASPQELIASLGAEQVVEFAIENGNGPTEEILRGLPGVQQVVHGNGRTRLTVSTVHATVPALMKLLEDRGAVLSELTTHHATLEDVFLSKTGRHLRDD